MTFLTTYYYKERKLFNVQSWIEAIRFLIINAILAIIFLFLAMEEIDWAIVSARENVKDRVIDETSWNLNNLFCFMKNIRI